MRQTISLTIAALLLAGVASSQSRLSIDGLRCEYLTDPLGIDEQKPRLSWILASEQRGQKQSAYRILVGSSASNLSKDRGDVWDSGKVSSAESTFIEYAGRPMKSGMAAFWKVRVWDKDQRASGWSRNAKWSMGLLNPSDWRAKWIGPAGPRDTAAPFPLLRKTVELAGKPEHAFAHVNPLGYYELYINGVKVDDHVLSPAVSDYSRRNLYVTHDVARYLVKGKNAIALWLGRGWYVKGHPGVIHDSPAVRMQIDGTLPGGKAAGIETDGSWRVRDSHLTPLGKGLAFGDYGGERYDARLEQGNWNAVDLDDSSWQQAAVLPAPDAVTSAQMVEPNRIIQTIPAVKVEPFAAGGYLIDMGRNFTGWLELKMPAELKAGTTVKLEYADTLPTERRVATANQRDEYIARDGSGQTFRSRFNYHGFRYVRVSGLSQAPSASDAKGYLIRTAYERASTFQSSNALFNRIYELVTWTYEALTLGGYVVDCPTRERLGYGGDAGTSIETGMFNFDAGGLYNRWSINWRDAQDPKNGDVPYTAPTYPDRGGGGPMWSGFAITLPWHLYMQYGDRRILETSYPSVSKLLEFWQTKTEGNLLQPYVSWGISMPQWNYLGDWVTPRRQQRGGPRDQVASKFINNCYYLYNLQLAVKMANLLGRKQDADAWSARASQLSRTLHEQFYNAAEKTYATGEQPYLAFPLFTGVTPEGLRNDVRQKLEQLIRVENKGHLDAGMHGTYFLLKQLQEDRRDDLIFEMTNKTTFPSWGYMLEQGATTAWESWSGGGSRIHDTLISIGAWFIQGVGGIQIDEQSPGFRHFLLKPAVTGDLRSAQTSYRSIRGRIVSNWRVEGGDLAVDVTIPPGTTASLWLPAANPESVTEGGKRASEAEAVRFQKMEGGRAVYTLESGSYRFVSKGGGRSE